ncbi:MAG TPA: NUDIX domain-containing protein [Longimicrobium sp.]
MAVEIGGRYTGELKMELRHGPSGQPLTTAAPRDNMGDGSSYSPTDLLAASLGSCMVTTMAIVARRDNIPFERAVREGLGATVHAGPEVGSVKHTFTHVRATYHAVLCAWRGGNPRPLRYEEWAWVTPGQVAGYALPVAQQRIAALAAAHLAGAPATE